MKILKSFLKKRVPRASRIKINNFHEIRVYIKDTNYIINNISESGIGVFAPAEDKEFQAGKIVDIDVNFVDQHCRVRAEIVYRTFTNVGIKIIDNLGQYKTLLYKYFASELAGLNVRQMDPNKLVKRMEGKPFWYYGDTHHELYYVLENSKIIYYQLRYQNFLFEKRDGHFLFQELKDDEFNFTGHKKSTMGFTTSKITPEFLKLVHRFIQTIDQLDPGVKNFIKEDLGKLS